MFEWSVGDRAICAALMICGGVLLALPLGRRSARIAWLLLLVAGLTNASILSFSPRNLVNINVVHHYLGAKYPIPYSRFYQAVNAARGRPQVIMRDLDRPPSMFRADCREQRSYFIDLMRDSGVEFDPLAPLEILSRQAEETGAIAMEAEQILEDLLPTHEVPDFRNDVNRSLAELRWNRDISTDYGFNGSPFYALVRQADPTIHRPFSRSTATLNLLWQLLWVAGIAGLIGAATGLSQDGRIACAALILASWDFVGYALPGLIFAGLWVPIALAVYAVHRQGPAFPGWRSRGPG